MGLPQGTGSFPMELELPVLLTNGISTEPEIRWRSLCTVEEVGWMGSTTVWYLIQQVLTTPYILECTHQAVVSDIVCIYTLILFNCTAFNHRLLSALYAWFSLVNCILCCGELPHWLEITPHSNISTPLLFAKNCCGGIFISNLSSSDNLL